MKVLKTFLLANPRFDLEVSEYAEKVRLWRAHMKRVEEDRANEKLAPIDRHQPYDRPRASELVEHAVDGDGNISYEVEDDSETILMARKLQLFNVVHEELLKAQAAIAPPGKRQFFELRERKILDKDTELRMELLQNRSKPGFLKKMFGGKEEDFDLEAAVDEQRSDEDTAHLADQKARRARFAALEEIAARATHDIEDLTLDTIEQWKAPDFSGV